MHVQHCYGIYQVGKTIHQRHDPLHAPAEIDALAKPIQQKCPLYDDVGKEDQQAHTDQEGRVGQKGSFRKQQVIDGRDAQDHDGEGIKNIEIEGHILGKTTVEKSVRRKGQNKQAGEQVRKPASLFKQSQLGEEPEQKE